MDLAIPASKVSTPSSGEFVGIVADNPDQKIELKAFHAEILNDHKVLAAEQNAYQRIPVVRNLNSTVVHRNYLQIKQDIEDIVDFEIQRILADPGLNYLKVKRMSAS